MAWTVGKLTVAGAVLAVICLLGNRFVLEGFDYYTLIEKCGSLLMVVGLAGGAFFGTCYVLRLDEMQEAIGIFTRKLRRRRKA
jgi:hypothetical protein